MRFNDEGIKSSSFSNYNYRQKSFAKKNPILKDEDIVFVGDSFIEKTSKVITKATSPVFGICESYRLFGDIFGD